MIKEKQSTLAGMVTLSGRGLHTGQQSQITIKPAPDNHGIVFQRVDLPEKPLIRAHISNLNDTSRSTNIRENGADVKTIEHFMAACAGMSLDNLLVEINCSEMPILNGSAEPYIQEFEKVGILQQNAKREYYTVEEVLKFEKPDLGIELMIVPSNNFKISVMVDYGTDILASQNVSLNKMSDFATEIAPCRTFVFLHELQYLVSNNLVKGGDIDNAIVFVDKKPKKEELEQLCQFFNRKDIEVTENGTLNNTQLHFHNEPARHKMLDLIGDLYLLGKPIKGTIVAKKPGHFANSEFTKLISECAVIAK